MILATSLVLHRAFSHGRSARWTRNTGVGLTVGFVVFAAYHAWTDELLVHFLLFLTMTSAVGLKTRALIRGLEQAKHEDEVRRLKQLAWLGFGEFVPLSFPPFVSLSLLQERFEGQGSVDGKLLQFARPSGTRCGMLINTSVVS